MDLIKKGLVLALIIGIFVLLTTTLALAGGYNVPLQYNNDSLYPQGPHGGYTTSTNKCKECHAVHLAEGSYRLTRANSASQACDFCHAETTGLAAIKVSLNANGHGVDTSTPDPVVSPNDTTPTPYTISKTNWGCSSCHSVHATNNRIVKLADETSNKLLLADPNPGKSYFLYNTSLIDTTTRSTPQGLATWCSACHNADIGSHKTARQALDKNGFTMTAYTHDSSDTTTSLDANGYALSSNGYVSPDNPVNYGPNCRQCHPADGGYTYPHKSSAPNLLMSAIDSGKTNLDRACINCHNTSSMP